MTQLYFDYYSNQTFLADEDEVKEIGKKMREILEDVKKKSRPMKKYYAWFINGKSGAAYVMRFKIKGSLRYQGDLYRCFIDDRYYVRTIDDLVKMVLKNNDWHIEADMALLIDHDTFVEWRANGIPRFMLDNEVIEWD